ncbi:MAG TPA: hypothetical protein VLG66_00210, partial [Alphaproteobacteria bacterium]|nr:hypothetical protein [Alphaproteobacteria bacterium]
YDRYSDRIATDEECPLVADYAGRPDEAAWPAYFVDALAWRLAAIFARAIKRDNQQADALDARCDRILFPRARLTDSQQRTACPDVAELVWVIGVDL